MRRWPAPHIPINKFYLAIVVLLICNLAIGAWSFSYIINQFSTSGVTLSEKREVAYDLSDYNRRLAAEMEVLDRSAVREALAGFNYDVEMAGSSDELTQIIQNQGKRVQEIIIREADARLLDQLLAVINQDDRVRQAETGTKLTIRLSEKGLNVIPENFLSSATLERIEELAVGERLSMDQVVEIRIENGVGRLEVPYNPAEQLQSLHEEIDTLRLSLHELKVQAGLADMSGPGVIVYLYDREGGTTTASIIHDADIRDVVNELFGSGAQGISVGGKRLTVTSSIRCSGSLIKVNDQLITVNPVEIKAVGDPDLLSSGLDIIKTTLEVNRGIKFEVIKSSNVNLPGAAKGGN